MHCTSSFLVIALAGEVHLVWVLYLVVTCGCSALLWPAGREGIDEPDLLLCSTR
jgi:hypothetical protein